ncbi:hypothetical protein SAMN05216486_11231 [bacterium JGI 053]|nr:hypothetical protein SAMN05216486_11231 [bacterium JGI 053]
MRILILPGLCSAIVLAACNGAADRVSIRGDFADSASAATVVRAVEAEREAEVKGGAFELRGLSAGPATLRLVRGADSAGTLALDNAPAGAGVVLHGLRTDARSGRVFPRSVELTGVDLLLVNGVRMANDAALPAEVDTPGVILALSGERDAVLFRPDDASLPDLRVVVGLGTETVTADGDPVDPATLARGDSVRVKGHADHGFVVAERLTVSRRAALEVASSAEAAPRPAEPRSSPAPAPPVVVAASTPRVVAPRVRVAPGPARVLGERGHGRGGGRGRRKGKG